MSATGFETRGVTPMSKSARGKSYTTGITPMSKSTGGESYTTDVTPMSKSTGGESYARGVTPMSETAGGESYTTDVTPMSKSTGGESYTRGITHRLPKLIPVVSPQPISFSFSGRTLSGLNSHCGVRSAFSFSRSRFLFPCGGVV